MINTVKKFQDLKADLWTQAGGKGRNLAGMYQSGLPVPEGFVVLPGAFRDNQLSPEAWAEIQNNLTSLRKSHKNALFAVRSSALCEDSAHASFAGGYETVLDVKSDDDILKAISAVYQSRQSERVKVYSTVQGIKQSDEIAIVIQLMIASEISGVLFTVDPVTGSHAQMTGNLVYGTGEQLVSGTVNAELFSFTKPGGRYDGPQAFKKYAARLYKYAVRLEADLGWPQDIEWAAAGGRLYLLQTRPVTSIQPGNLDTYEWNDTLDGDYIWTNTNLAEAIPDVMTPFTWSIMRYLDKEQSMIPGWYLCSGNIGGRIYTNISRLLSVLTLFGIKARQGARSIRYVFGEIPETMNIPVYPYTFSSIFKTILPKIREVNKKRKKLVQNIPQYLKETPGWCFSMTENIRNTKSPEDLAALWKHKLQPYLLKSWFMLLKDGEKRNLSMILSKKLIQLTGTEDFCGLIYQMCSDSGMASLNPVLGIAKIIKGELSRGEYIRLYGHQVSHIGVLADNSAEQSGWLDKTISDYKKAGTDVEKLLAQKLAQQEEIWKRFAKQYPHKVKWLKKQIAKVCFYSLQREAARSEQMRVNQVVGVFAQKAAEFTGTGKDMVFLYLDEVINLLSGDKTALKNLKTRKETYLKYLTLPPLPSVIRGRFDPFQWAKDPDRRIDYFDNSVPIDRMAQTDTKILKGFAGAPGRVTGKVRVLADAEEGTKLQAGEILVAATTNIGWTPLFPRAAAVITDIGAPLSHAAIVARELGIPAVVGCGNATSVLKSGDSVMVDGARGIVRILNNE